MKKDEELDEFLNDGSSEIKNIDITKDDSIDILAEKLDIKTKRFNAEMIKKFKEAKEKHDNALVSNDKTVPVSSRDFETRVYLWLMEGWSEVKITAELVTTYGRSEASAKKIIENVNKSFCSINPAEVNILKSKYLDMYGDLYTRALEKKDLAVARNILDSVVKLQGLVTKRSESKVENIFTIEF